MHIKSILSFWSRIKSQNFKEFFDTSPQNLLSPITHVCKFIGQDILFVAVKNAICLVLHNGNVNYNADSQHTIYGQADAREKIA